MKRKTNKTNPFRKMGMLLLSLCMLATGILGAGSVMAADDQQADQAEVEVLSSGTAETICSHVWDTKYTVDKAATCTTPGYKSIHCVYCGIPDYRTQQVIPATGHRWDSGVWCWGTGCLHSGYRHYTCLVCGATWDDWVDSGNHVWETCYRVDIAPTCVSVGYRSIHCSICGAVKPGSVRKIPMTGHTWNQGVVVGSATCDKPGTMRYTCLVCGTIKDVKIPSGAHTWETAYRVDKAATCTEAGSESIHCSICGAIKPGSSREIPKIGHTFGEWKTTVEPTYTKEGVQQRSCTVCGTVEKSTLAKKDFGQASVTMKAAVPTGFDRIRLSWSTVSGASGYRIYRQGEGETWRTLETITRPGAKTYVDIGVNPETLYSYRVRPFINDNGSTRWGAYSEILSTSTSLEPGYIVRINSKPGKNVLKMAKVNGATGYEIDCRIGDGEYTKVGESAKVQFTHKGVQPGTTYYYKVRPYRIFGDKTVYGAWSAEEVVTTK